MVVMTSDVCAAAPEVLINFSDGDSAQKKINIKKINVQVYFIVDFTPHEVNSYFSLKLHFQSNQNKNVFLFLSLHMKI